MLASAVKNAQIQNLLDKVLSVEKCKVYKPSHKVYDLVEKEFNIKKNNVELKIQVMHGTCMLQHIMDLKQFG